MKDFELYSVQEPPKTTKCETQIIGFSDDDYMWVSFLHTDTLVLTLAIANHRIHRILIDTGSLVLFKTAFELMKIDRGKIVPARHSLVGFLGEQLFPFRSIELPVMVRTYPSQKTIMVKFLLIDRPSGYNAILPKLALNEIKAVTLTLYLSIKFPTQEGIRVQKVD
jgi:hypothetical protein